MANRAFEARQSGTEAKVGAVELRRGLVVVGAAYVEAVGFGKACGIAVWRRQAAARQNPPLRIGCPAISQSTVATRSVS